MRVIETCVKEEVLNRPASLTYEVNVSLGYALWDGNASSFKQSVAEADLMMYEDKRSA